MVKYAFSDIHGYYDILQHILSYCKEDDEIYFLGDAADRGPDGIKCIQTLLNDKRIIYLKGNHEQFFLDTYKEYMTEREWLEKDFFHSAMYSWFSNGGNETWYQFQELNHKEQIDLIQKLQNLPIYIELKDNNIFLCHSGCNQENLLNIKNEPEETFIWNRHHLKNNGTTWSITFVHGHTPVQVLHQFNSNISLIRTKPEIVKYDNGHKIDIDLGVFASKTTCLLNLDTLIPIYFNENGLIK